MKQFTKYLVASVIGIAIGLIAVWIYYKNQEPIVPPEPDISEELRKIDSLSQLVSEKEDQIEKLKDSVRVIKIYVEAEKDSIKSLPLTDNVLLLATNIEEYSGKRDSLPQIAEIPGFEVPTVAISEEQTKTINCVFSDLRASIEESDYLEKIIENDQTIINAKDSIIQEKESIFIKTEDAYKYTIEGLQKSLKRQKMEKNIWVGALGTTAVILGGILIFK